MRIALISKLWEETSPFSDGGTGMVVGCLAEELSAMGHDVTVFGVGSSRISVKVESVTNKPFSKYEEGLHYWNIEKAFRDHDKFDIINCWVDQTAVYFSRFTETPSIHTIDYGDLSKSTIRMLKYHKDLNYIAISKSVQNLIPELNWLDVVYNGTQTENFPFDPNPDDYLFFIGRISPQKGPDKAIQVALKTGRKLIMVGKTRPQYDENFLEGKIYPFIDGKKIIHYEHVDFVKRVKLYQKAKALINPVSYLEAFGLTMTESMSCGTPVVTLKNGAAPEVVENGKTGFVCENIEEMVDSVGKIDKISRNYCQEYTRKKFSVRGMAQGYERVFKKLLKR